MLTPPIAFFIYMLLGGLFIFAGRKLASPKESPLHHSLYASGEAHSGAANPGYSPFFKTVLFFAILHLGVLIVASGAPSLLVCVYIVGLAAALILLIAG